MIRKTWEPIDTHRRAWETVDMEDAALEMIGLSSDMETYCQDIHKRFLHENDLQAWPLKITVNPITPRQYKLVIESGIQGQRWEKDTASPDHDIRQKLFRFLEINHRTKATAKGPEMV